jgi:hypothetical protein
MLNIPSSNEDLQSWRSRRANFAEELLLRGQEGWSSRLEIDVDDMIGAKGRKLEPTSDMWPDDLSPDDDWTPNEGAVRNGAAKDGIEFPGYIEEGWGHEGHFEQIAPLLSKLLARKADDAVKFLGKAVDRLREPVRTVAINHLYLDQDAEHTARCLGTSIETVVFLADIALDQLAEHISFE